MQNSVRPWNEAKHQFDLLYRQAQEVTASILQATAQDSALLQARNMAGKLSQSDQFYDYQKQEWLSRLRKPERKRNPENITPADIEQVLQAGIPKDHYGNLLPMKRSTLNHQFRNRRLSRQRLEELLTETASVTRYDLIMLQFFVYAYQDRKTDSSLKYYRGFIERTNEVLESCGMGPLYTANPFECFLLMCILSEDPMGTYTDVMEQSYREVTV